MRDECVVLIGVSADNRIRRLRARSLAEGREDVPFNSLRVGIASENQFRAVAAVVNVNTRSPEFFGSRDPSLSPARPPRPFPSRHHAPARGRSIVASLEY